MGCRLCTLPQSDENYKPRRGLNQVNGSWSQWEHGQDGRSTEVQVRRRVAHSKTQAVDRETHRNVKQDFLKRLEDWRRFPSADAALHKPELGKFLLPKRCQVERCDLSNRLNRFQSEQKNVKIKVSAGNDGEEGTPRTQNTQEYYGGDADATAAMFSQHQEKDSGVGRTDESSELEILPDEQNSSRDSQPKNQNPTARQETMGVRSPTESCASEDGEDFLCVPDAACQHFQKQLERKCLMDANSPRGALENGPSVNYDDDLEIQMLKEELRRIERECLSILRAHKSHGENGSPVKNLTEQLKVNAANHLHMDQRGCEKSCCTTSQANAASPNVNCWTTSQENATNPNANCWTTSQANATNLNANCWTTSQENATILNANCWTTSQENATNPNANCWTTSQENATNPDANCWTISQGITDTENKCEENGRMSLTKLHLPPIRETRHSSVPGAKREVSAPAIRQSEKRRPKNPVRTPSLLQQTSAQSFASLGVNPVTSKPEMEWKVKIRRDGSRYITRVPSRGQLRRARALRICEERRGVTTDDDTASELKMGRYWSKEKRKQHAAQAKEQRLRREHVKRGRMEVSIQEPDIIQLSNKKMMKRRNRRVLDNWMTIQELLSHGTKSLDGKRVYHSLLSVTTV